MAPLEMLFEAIFVVTRCHPPQAKGRRLNLPAVATLLDKHIIPVCTTLNIPFAIEDGRQCYAITNVIAKTPCNATQ